MVCIMKNSPMCKLSISFILIFTFFISCQKSKDKEIKKKNYWDTIEIITDNRKVVVYFDKDTATSEFTTYKKVSGNGPTVNYKLQKIEKKNFKINKRERYSLYNNVFRLFTKPTFTNKSATCYVGNVLVKLKDRKTTLICEYKSVGNWSEVSSETKNIYNLITKK